MIASAFDSPLGPKSVHSALASELRMFAKVGRHNFPLVQYPPPSGSPRSTRFAVCLTPAILFAKFAIQPNGFVYARWNQWAYINMTIHDQLPVRNLLLEMAQPPTPNFHHHSTTCCAITGRSLTPATKSFSKTFGRR
jgi:hypothetical protein